MRIEGYVSKKNIRRWLDNYESLEASDVLPDALPGNSGPKNYDGVSAGRLNKIMLDHAIGQLTPFMQRVVACKWTKPIRAKEACQLLGITREIYKNRCDLAIEAIYRNVNGPAANFKALGEAVYGS